MTSKLIAVECDGEKFLKVRKWEKGTGICGRCGILFSISCSNVWALDSESGNLSSISGSFIY